MADVARASIGNSVNYTIGGKKYNAGDVSRQQPSQTGKAKTASDISRSAAHNVQSQTADYQKSGSGIINSGIQSRMSSDPKSVDTIKTANASGQSGSPYRAPTMTGYAANTGATHTTSYMGSSNIKTQSEISSEAYRSVQNQTDDYQKTNAYGTAQPVIRDRVSQTPTNVGGIQTGKSFFGAVNETRNREISIANAANQINRTVQSAMSGQDDLGTQTMGTGVTGAVDAGIKAFQTAQAVTEAAPTVANAAARGIEATAGGLYKVGQGAYQVGLTGTLAVAAVCRTASFVQAGQFNAISHASLQMLKAQAVATGLSQTVISQRIIHAVNTGVQTVSYAKNQIKTGYVVAKAATTRIIRGVTSGAFTVEIAKNTLAKYANKAVHAGMLGIKTGVKVGVRTAGHAIVKGVTKGVPFVTFKGIPKAAKLTGSGIYMIGGLLRKSDDFAVQGLGNTMAAAQVGAKVGVKTAVTGTKAVKQTVKTAVNGGKAAYAAYSFIKNEGLRAAWNAGRRKAAKAAAEAGKSIVTAIINVIKALGRKVIIPLIIIVVVVMAISGVITVPVTAIGSIFSSMFSAKDTGTDYDVRDFLNGIVSGLSADFKQDLADDMADSWSSYHIVRFYSNVNTDPEEVIEPTLDGVSSVFPTDDDILNMVEAIFNAVILMEYDLEPTEAEAKSLTEVMFEKLFTITTETSVEYCGQDLLTGEGDVITHGCGHIHALGDCPNPLTGFHDDYTCDTCDEKTCPGHLLGSGDIYYCGGCEFSCSGYAYCDSHDVISYTLSIDGLYALEAEYFLDPIEQLSNIGSRTEDEEIKLQELKDYYEIFLEMLKQAGINHGGGMTMADLSGVAFINGTRKSNQDVIDLALTQVGQKGGQPYWSYYGFTSRVEWCACFVNWCMRHTTSASSAYPTTENNAYCQTVANYFMSIGQWGSRSFTNVAAGDTIFFDWNGDGHTDHIGLVIGTDGVNVYTVEGNSGDEVKIKSYALGSGVIYGYGLMNY